MKNEKRLIGEFKHEVMSEFIRLCRGNDFNKLTLLKIGDTIDRLYEKYSTLPSVDAVEVVHGRWEDVYGGKYAKPRYMCSVCKEKSLYAYIRGFLGGWIKMQALTDYCPHCGAKMDGDMNDNEAT